MNAETLAALGIDAGRWNRPLAAACAIHDILTENREQYWLAQCAHESLGFTRLTENLNYSAQGLLANFAKYFTPEEAEQYARNQAAIANHVYANRNGNADEASGDGWRFRGRGLIQITGRANYARCGRALGQDFVTYPDNLAIDENAARSAAWFWQTNGCNELADAGNFVGTTRRINGGLNGQADRLKWLARIREAWV